MRVIDSPLGQPHLVFLEAKLQGGRACFRRAGMKREFRGKLGVLQPIQDIPHDWNFWMPAITVNWTAGSANLETLKEVDVAAGHRAFVGHGEGRLHRVNFQRRPRKSEIVEFPMIVQHLNWTARIKGSRHGVAVRRKVAVCGEERICRPRSAEGQGERDLIDVPQLLVVLEEAGVFKQE